MNSSGELMSPSSWVHAARRLLAVLLIAVAALGSDGGVSPSCALSPDEQLKDAVLEARARELSAELRCLVCQNQSIDDSDAPLAKDLRRLVRERLEAGDSNAEVKSFLVARYGNFVLLKPPFGWHTLLLWLAPAFVLLATIAFVVRAMQARRVLDASSRSGAGLSPEEEERLDKLLRATAEDGQ
ncbi:MAG: cytochrome c-type biogenesis protein CcmH [Hyphomicrobiaceae bacterium]